MTTPGSPAVPARTRSRRHAVSESLQDLIAALSVLNQRVGSHLDLKGSDVEVLDMIRRHSPLTPGELARQAGVHPATMTGILDRLERGGWIARERDPSDRRGVLTRPVRRRTGEVIRLYAGMNAALDSICAEYGDDQLELLVSFLRRAAQAGRGAAEKLSASS